MLKKEHVELFNRYLKKDLSESQLEELKEILRSEEGRKSFVGFMQETSLIIHSSRQMHSVEEEDAQISELVKKSEEKLLSHIKQEKTRQQKSMDVKKVKSSANRNRERPRALHFLYLMTLGLAASIIFYIISPSKRVNDHVKTQDPLIKSVARVTSLKGLGNVKMGDWLKPGEISLVEGNLEITFDSGAVIFLQGRSSLNLETEKRAFLNYGKMSARVPEEAIGFIVNTPQGTVVDLGTEFAISVDKENAMEVHVIEGEVEADSISGNQPKLLKKDEAIRIEKNGSLVEDTKLSQMHFSRVPEFKSHIDYNFIYWPFDKVKKKMVFDQGNGGMGGSFDLLLPNPKENIRPGKFGKALNLSGKGEYAQSSFPGIGAANPRTVAFWVKIPPDSLQKEAYAIVSWGKVAPSQKWQVGYNPNPRNGVVGAIRTEFSQGYVIGTTDLRDGRWHHVVSMFVGGENPDVATHVRHYIDGRLEGVSGFEPRKINTNIHDPDTQPVYLGKYINHNRWYFRGKIDEFFIFDGALTPHQISLLRKNEIK